MDGTLLSLRGITKTYVNGDVETPVLFGVHLDVMAGEFVSLMGPSGSGKSTLMHIMSLLDRPDSGTYLFAGTETGTLSNEGRAKLRLDKIGFVFQAFHLLPRLTVLENVTLPLLYANETAKRRVERARAVLEEVGLTDRANFRPTQLSGGQKQRVAIARALVNEPEVIFADEPTGNLDSKSSQQVLEILKDLNREGHTIILITHDKDIAEHARRIIGIKDGRIESD